MNLVCSADTAAPSVPSSFAPSSAIFSSIGFGSIAGPVFADAGTGGLAAARKMTNSPRRMSAHSQPTSARVTLRLSPNILALPHRLRRPCEIGGALAQLGDRALEVVQLLLALDRALEHAALLGGHLVEHLVGLGAAEAARGDARR